MHGIRTLLKGLIIFKDLFQNKFIFSNNSFRLFFCSLRCIIPLIHRCSAIKQWLNSRSGHKTATGEILTELWWTILRNKPAVPLGTYKYHKISASTVCVFRSISKEGTTC